MCERREREGEETEHLERERERERVGEREREREREKRGIIRISTRHLREYFIDPYHFTMATWEHQTLK